MTDARFPERWLNDRRILTLTSDNFRGFMLSLAWCASNRTDGVIGRHDTALMPWLTADTPNRLVTSGLWTALSDGWLVDGYTVHQSTRSQLESAEEARAKDRERKRHERERSRLKSAGQPGVHPDVPPDVHTDVRPESTRPGQDRPGEEVLPGATASILTSNKVDAAPVRDAVASSPQCEHCGKTSSWSLVSKGGLLLCRRCSGAMS